MLDKKGHWRVGRLKESAYRLCNKDLFSRRSVEISMIWEPLIKTIIRQMTAKLEQQKKREKASVSAIKHDK